MKKREVRSKLREWKKYGGERKSYSERKNGYRDLCEKKKRKDNEK